jgi:hypothetical protein
MLALMLALDFTRDMNRNTAHAGTLVPQSLSPGYIKVDNR